MKWDAAFMRRSAVRRGSRAVRDVAGVGGDAGQCVEGEDLDVGSVVAPGVVEDASRGVPRRRAPRRWRPARRGGIRRARPVRRRRQRGATSLPPRAPSALVRPVRARAGHARGARGRARRGARRRWPRPCRPRARGWRRRRGSHRPGTVLARGWRADTPRSAGTRDAREVSRRSDSGGRRRRRSGARCGRSSPRRPRRGRGATGRRRIRSQCSTRSTASTLRASVAGGDRCSRCEEPVGGLVPRPVEPCRRAQSLRSVSSSAWRNSPSCDTT